MIRALAIACLVCGSASAQSELPPGPNDILALLEQEARFRAAQLQARGEDGAMVDLTYTARLDGCVLTWRSGLEDWSLGVEIVIDLAGADIIALPPVPGVDGTPTARVALRSSDATLRAMAPAIWAYMGGDPALMPNPGEVLARYATHDPFGAAGWWDPSMMTLFQQRLANAKWDAATDADQTGLLATNNDAWLGPDRAFWTPELRTPGANAQLLVPPGDAEGVARMIEGFVSAHCAGAS